jgi:hypothetical protein
MDAGGLILKTTSKSGARLVQKQTIFHDFIDLMNGTGLAAKALALVPLYGLLETPVRCSKTPFQA